MKQKPCKVTLVDGLSQENQRAVKLMDSVELKIMFNTAHSQLTVHNSLLISESMKAATCAGPT